MAIRENLIRLFAGVQWLGFMFANTVVIPLSIGAAFHWTGGEISGAMSRSFLLTGIACLLQVFFGHGLPLMEGQSGLWWSVILGLAATAPGPGVSLAEIGGSLSLGIILSGLLMALFGTLGFHKLLNRLFTPIVMAVLLILLAAQLSDMFLQGMLGMTTQGRIEPGVAVLSIFISLVVGVLTIKGKGLLSNFSILIGLALGWISYVFLFGSPSSIEPPTAHEMIAIFSWGNPSWHIRVVLTVVLAGMINTTNTVATLRASEPLFKKSAQGKQYRRSFVVTGLTTVLAGVFTVVPYAPYTSSIGFLRTTRLTERQPFIIGAVLFMILGLFPPISGFFSTLPMSVGEAVLFVAYLQLFGSALQTLEAFRFDFRTIFPIALPVLTGLAIQSMPHGAFSGLPGFIEPLLDNGMLVGILLAIVLENGVRWNHQTNS